MKAWYHCGDNRYAEIEFADTGFGCGYDRTERTLMLMFNNLTNVDCWKDWEELDVEITLDE